MTKCNMMTFRVGDDLKRMIDELCAQRNESRSDLLRELIAGAAQQAREDKPRG